MKNRRLRPAVRRPVLRAGGIGLRFYELTVERHRRAQRAWDRASSRGERQARGIDHGRAVRCAETAEVGAATGERARAIDDRTRVVGVVALGRLGDAQEL